MPGQVDSEEERRKVGLPPRIFFYTLDQVAAMLQVDEDELRKRYLYFAGRDVGFQQPGQLYVVNISPDSKAEWRCSDREFMRFLRHKKIRAYDLARLL